MLKELQGHDIIANAAPREESCLVGRDNRPNHSPKTGRQDLGKQSVICPQQCNRAVIGRVRTIPILVKHGNQTVMEPRRKLLQLANSREQACKNRRKLLPTTTVQLHRDTIKPRTSSPTTMSQSLLNLIRGNNANSEGGEVGWGRGGGTERKGSHDFRQRRRPWGEGSRGC